MSIQIPSPREQAHQLILDALSTGVRGELRDALKNAEAIAAAGRRRSGLTDIECRSLKQGQALSDPDHPGLFLKNGARKGKRWVFRYKKPFSNTAREFVFGTYPEVTLSEARGQWWKLRELRAKGLDPADHLTATNAQTKPVTVANLVDQYLSDYAYKVKRSHATDERLLRRHLVPEYGSLPATGFGYKEAAGLLHSVDLGGAPREAEKLRACISTMFNFASGRTRKILVTQPILSPTHDNPVSAVLLPKRLAKNHNPTGQELQAYLNGIDAMRYGDVLRFQALTMTRIGEFAQAAWSEIDLDAGRWTIPAERAKNGCEHLVLLSSQALDILRNRKQCEMLESPTPYVFPAKTDPAKPLDPQQAQKALANARPKLRLPSAFTSHSLRHAALTWAAEEGCPRDVRDRLTNHVSGGGVDSIYNAAQLNQPARHWWQRWANHLDMVKAANVVRLPSPNWVDTA